MQALTDRVTTERLQLHSLLHLLLSCPSCCSLALLLNKVNPKWVPALTNLAVAYRALAVEQEARSRQQQQEGGGGGGGGGGGAGADADADAGVSYIDEAVAAMKV